jgi:hypothetical protein
MMHLSLSESVCCNTPHLMASFRIEGRPNMSGSEYCKRRAISRQFVTPYRQLTMMRSEYRRFTFNERAAPTAGARIATNVVDMRTSE